MKISQKLDLDRDEAVVLERFKKITGFSEVAYHVKERPTGPYFVIELLNPNERFFSIVERISNELCEDNKFRGRITIKKKSAPSANRLSLPETSLLQTVIAECLTATSSTFGEDYLNRYIRSVSGAEEQILAKSNNIVLGRRGSGKSSLLLYALHHHKMGIGPYSWTTLQTYEGRRDFAVIVDVFIDILSQLEAQVAASYTPEIGQLISSIEAILESDDMQSKLDLIVPRARRVLGRLSKSLGPIFIFLDDLHVIGENIQPLLLSKVYSIARDNNIFLKISGIEQLTKNWDASSRKGLETPHDAQLIKLDHNLTMPGKSMDHIHSILDAHAKYCGLPSIDYICGSEVIKRLVWVAAGVPRDALSIFSSAASRAMMKDQKKVSITSVNEAASVTADTKLADLSIDASERKTEIENAFEKVKNFCLVKRKKNAFLVEIGANSPAINLIREFIGLRLLHILHEGVTPHEAGRRYMGLMLDYGFYVGVRAARSVDVFQKEPEQIAAKDLRNLPIFPLSEILVE